MPNNYTRDEATSLFPRLVIQSGTLQIRRGNVEASIENYAQLIMAWAHCVHTYIQVSEVEGLSSSPLLYLVY